MMRAGSTGPLCAPPVVYRIHGQPWHCIFNDEVGVSTWCANHHELFVHASAKQLAEIPGCAGISVETTFSRLRRVLGRRAA